MTATAFQPHANALSLTPVTAAALRRTSQRGGDLERLHLEARACDPYEAMQEAEEVAALRDKGRQGRRAPTSLGEVAHWL